MTPILIVHVAAGTAALAAGAVALIAPKGKATHIRSGALFAAAMLVMTAMGAWQAFLIPQRGTGAIGIITFYLVLSGWLTVRRRPGIVGRAEYAATFLGVCGTGLMIAFAYQARTSPNGRLDSLPAEIHYVFAAIAALAVAYDVVMLRTSSLVGPRRVARHVWRMCTALLVAALSFFIGQQKVMPEIMRGSPALIAPELFVLVAMIYWLVRTKRGSKLRRAEVN